MAKRAVERCPGKLNVISIERDRPVDANLCKNHLQLKIDDIDDHHIEKFDKALKAKGIVYPEIKDIEAAIAFDKQCDGNIHIIHCHAGISRSPSIGYAILRSRGMTKEKSMKKILKLQPYAMPNERIVRMADQLFG